MARRESQTFLSISALSIAVGEEEVVEEAASSTGRSPWMLWPAPSTPLDPGGRLAAQQLGHVVVVDHRPRPCRAPASRARSAPRRRPTGRRTRVRPRPSSPSRKRA